MIAQGVAQLCNGHPHRPVSVHSWTVEIFADNLAAVATAPKV